MDVFHSPIGSIYYQRDYFQYNKLERNATTHLGKRSKLFTAFSPFGAADIGAWALSWSILAFSIMAFATSRRWTFPVAVFGIFAVKYTFKTY
jgi:hypothetical protein